MCPWLGGIKITLVWSHDFPMVNENFSSGSPQKTEKPESFTLGSMKLLAALDKHLDSSYFSERVSGLARLTCEPMQISSVSEEEEQERGRLLVGTPLYVEYSR